MEHKQTKTTLSVQIYTLTLKTNIGKHVMHVDMACIGLIAQLNDFREAFILWYNTAP